jgi:hypothetical protein
MVGARRRHWGEERVSHRRGTVAGKEAAPFGRRRSLGREPSWLGETDGVAGAGWRLRGSDEAGRQPNKIEKRGFSGAQGRGRSGAVALLTG